MGRPCVMLISIDALKPEFVFEGERFGLDLPNLRRLFLHGGASARKGMKSVFPSFTYACHQSMITGTYPEKHGTFNNIVFDADGTHNGAWHWCVSDSVQNLWQLASENGYVTASMAFPTSVGAKGDFIAPEFWYDGTRLDSRLIDALARPQGLVAEMEAVIGQYPGGLDLTPDGDRRRFEGAMWLLESKLAPACGGRPFFLSMYFASYDETAHTHGVYSPQALDVLRTLDRYVGQAVERASAVSCGGLVTCVVSDHGTIDNTHNIRPNVIFRQYGLIDGSDGKVSSWKAWSHRSGGTAEVRLFNPGDEAMRGKVEALLRALEKDSGSGIAKVLTGEQARAERHGFPLCDFAIIAKRGYEIRDDFEGDYITEKTTQRAQHGYDEEYPEMLAFYGICGEGIARARDLGRVNLIDVAPTLAGIMGITMGDAQGKSLL